jgi:hypothetical protein
MDSSKARFRKPSPRSPRRPATSEDWSCLLVWPILFWITIPITVLTLSLFSLVLNAPLVMLAARIVPGFGVDSFWRAIAFSIILAFSNAIFHATGKQVRELPITLDKLL